MAMALGRQRTILTRLGTFRAASDVDGLNAISLSNSPQPRSALRRRLANQHCAVNDRDDYLNPGQAGDFDAALTEPGVSTANTAQRPESGVDVRQRLRLMLYELGSIETTLSEARERRTYPAGMQLPANEWNRSHEDLSKHPELDQVLDSVKKAYERANQLNAFVGPRIRDDPRVMNEDRIDQVLNLVTSAESQLRIEIDRRTTQ
jgi:hypothetical protein